MGDGIRAALVALWSAPLRRLRWLVRAQSGLLCAVAAASAVLVAAAASVPLYLSSAGAEAVSLQAAERCPRDTGAVLHSEPVALPAEAPNSAANANVDVAPPDPFAPLAGLLGSSELWFRRDSLSLEGQSLHGASEVALVAHEDALAHIVPVEGADPAGARGVWISDRFAETTALAPGSQARLIATPTSFDDGGPEREAAVEIPIAGTYRNLAGLPPDRFWCSQADLLTGEFGQFLPPVLVADPATYLDIVAALGDESAVGSWEAGLPADGLTLSQADRLVDELACRSASADTLAWCAGVEHDGEGITSPAGRRGPASYDDEEDFLGGVLDSHLPYVVRRSRAIQSAVGGGVWPVAVLAALAGIGLVASAASLWAERKRRELTLLTVRGISPAVLGTRAALEAAVPLLVGGVAGIGLAYGAVRLLGPSPQIEPSALARSAVAGAVTTVAGAVAFGMVISGRVRPAGRHRRWWRRLRVVPWELGAVLCAVISYRRLGEWGVPVSQGPEVSRVDVLGLLFPLLFMVGAVGLVTRLLAWVLGPLRRVSRGWPVPVYLAIRRIARYRLAATGLLASSAIAGGVLCYATSLDRSLDATLQAKASTSIGSDLVVRLGVREEMPPALVDDATVVDLFRSAWIDAGEDRVDDVAVRAIDPDTFADVAFWDGSFADGSLDDLMEQIAQPGSGKVPAVVVGAADIPDGAELHIRGRTSTQLQLEPIPGVAAFPGMRRNGTTVFVAAAALAPDDPGRDLSEVWLRGDRDAALSTLQAAGTDFVEGRSNAEVADETAFRTVSWTFAFMRSLGVAAGALVVAATAVYLDARRRDRVLGYAFARRMGLARRSHRRAILVELVMSVAVGCWLGLMVALMGAWLASDRIDPIPAFPPAPLFRPAVAVAALVGVLSFVAVGCGAVLAQRRTDKDDPVEVLRAGV